MIKAMAEKSLNKFGKEAQMEAQKIFDKSKKEMIQEYKNHPITQEIKAGPQAPNSSNTLGGYGNLFSFIGFPNEGGDPTEKVEEHLKSETSLSTSPKITQSESKITFSFQVKAPSNDSIKESTPMPFEPGKSWVYSIERGISGLSHYLYKKFLPQSRSGSGVQADNKVRDLTYRPVKYFSQILNNFKSKLK